MTPQVIQTRKYKNQKVKAVVIRTGYLTSKGDLVRSILYPPPVDFQFESDSYKFILVLAFIATLGMAYTLAKVGFSSSAITATKGLCLCRFCYISQLKG
jgi:magnesium-transporting ATPase (P-type)